MNDPQEFAQQVAEMQRNLQKEQEKLASEMINVTAGTESKTVTVTITGQHKLTKVVIAPDALKDGANLPELIIQVVNEAIDKSSQLAAERLNPIAKIMDPNK